MSPLQVDRRGILVSLVGRGQAQVPLVLTRGGSEDVRACVVANTVFVGSDLGALASCEICSVPPRWYVTGLPHGPHPRESGCGPTRRGGGPCASMHLLPWREQVVVLVAMEATPTVAAHAAGDVYDPQDQSWRALPTLSLIRVVGRREWWLSTSQIRPRSVCDSPNPPGIETPLHFWSIIF